MLAPLYKVPSINEKHCHLFTDQVRKPDCTLDIPLSHLPGFALAASDFLWQDQHANQAEAGKIIESAINIQVNHWLRNELSNQFD